jgi:hypothetical protein
VIIVMSGKILLSPSARLVSGFHGQNFYHERVGFGSMREGYHDQDIGAVPCTIVEFDDLDGVSRIDTERPALSDNVTAEAIVKEAMDVVLHPRGDTTSPLASNAGEPVYIEPELNAHNPGRMITPGEVWAGQPNA